MTIEKKRDKYLYDQTNLKIICIIVHFVIIIYFFIVKFYF